MKKFDNVKYNIILSLSYMKLWFSLNDILMKRKYAILKTSRNAHDSNKENYNFIPF